MSGDWGKVAVVFRTGGAPHPKFVEAWTWLVWLGLRPGDMVMAPAVRFPPHRACNHIIRSFLGDEPLTDCDTLCFIDDDHVFGYDTLAKLRDNVEGQQYDVLGALYAARGPAGRENHFPVMLRRNGEDDDGFPKYMTPSHLEPGKVYACDALGFGFTLVRRWLLEAIADPWVEYREPTTTEDVIFCEKVVAAGGTLAVDAGAMIGHLHDLVVVPKMGRADERTTTNSAAGARPA